DWMPVACRAQAILQNESRHAMLIEPNGVAFPFVVRQTAIATAGTNHERRARSLLRARQKWSERGSILFRLAQCAGRTFGPEREGIGGLRQGCNTRPKQSEQGVKNSH